MRDDFAIFILTHGRPEQMCTLDTLDKTNYNGKWYLVLDNEDETIEDYRKKYGDAHIYIFDKRKAMARTDAMDNFSKANAIVYARNQSYAIAKELGIKYFLQLDDDYSGLQMRYVENGKLKQVAPYDLNSIIDAMIEFLEASDAETVAFAQGGDFIGGVKGGKFHKGILRKSMNSFFCRVDRPIQFKGTMNEDVTTYTTLGSRGKLFFTITSVNIVQKATQSLTGGMSEEYSTSGTFNKSFYTVMSMPSAVKVGVLNTSHPRIHHEIKWDNCVPKILNKRWKK